MTICHATSSRTNPYNQITVNGSSINEVANALANGHGDHTGPVFSVDLPQHTDWGDIIPAFGSFPGINTGSTDWIANGCRAPGPVTYTGEATVSGSMDICTVDLVDVTVSYSATETATSTQSQAAADAAAQASAEAAAAADLAAQLEQYPDYTEGVCPAVETFTGEATVSGSTPICTADGADVTVSYTSGLVTRTSTESQEAAGAAAQAAAETAAAEALATELAGYPGYTEGVCPVTPPPTEPPTTPPTTPTTPTEPETVAPVLPATVEEPVEETAEPETVAPVLPATVEEPETVAVPLPATVQTPASIPAGDGSSSPQVPSGAVALMGVGLVGLGASTATLLRRRVQPTGDAR